MSINKKRGSIALARSLCYQINGAADDSDDIDGGGYGSVDIAEILSAEVERLREALAQQQPVFDCPRCGHVCSQREWVGLTDEEIKATWSQLWYDLNHGKLSAPDAAVRSNVVVFGEALEAKLKERNHD